MALHVNYWMSRFELCERYKDILHHPNMMSIGIEIAFELTLQKLLRSCLLFVNILKLNLYFTYN